MAEQFDPYYKWLGIPPSDRPIHFYRLLGIPLFEDNVDVISVAADRQMAHVKTFATGRYAEVSQKILNELGQAKVCLLDFEAKLHYDVELKSFLSGSNRVVEREPAETERLFDELANFGENRRRPSDSVPLSTPAPIVKPVRLPTQAGGEFPIGKLLLGFAGLVGLALGIVLATFVLRGLFASSQTFRPSAIELDDFSEVGDGEAAMVANVAAMSLNRFDCQMDSAGRPAIRSSGKHYVVFTKGRRNGRLVDCQAEYWRDDADAGPRWRLTKLVVDDEVLHQSQHRIEMRK